MNPSATLSRACRSVTAVGLLGKEAVVEEPLAELGEPALLVGLPEGTFERDLVAGGSQR